MRITTAAVMAIALMHSAHSADVTYRKVFGDWAAVVGTDAMTDAAVCGAIYKKDKAVSYTNKDAFKIDMRGRGGATSFVYRFGKAQASEVESVQDYENNVITVPVHVAEALDAHLLKIRGETVLRTPINLDISLKGLKEARAAIASRCDMAELPSAHGGAPDWAKWQATPSADR